MMTIDPEKLMRFNQYQNMDTPELQANADCFWVSPEGRKFPIRYGHHDDFVDMVLDTDICSFEEEGLAGWARISRTRLMHCKPLTPAQNNIINRLPITMVENLSALY